MAVTNISSRRLRALRAGRGGLRIRHASVSPSSTLETFPHLPSGRFLLKEHICIPCCLDGLLPQPPELVNGHRTAGTFFLKRLGMVCRAYGSFLNSALYLGSRLRQCSSP